MSQLQVQLQHNIRRGWIALLAVAGSLAGSAIAQPLGHCRFDSTTLQFEGDVTTQASCLLRRVAKWGKVDNGSATLPAALSEIIDKPTGLLTTQLRAYLAAHTIDEAMLGGSLSHELSHAYGGAPSAKLAQYFVIHDTSSPWLGNDKFPSNEVVMLNSFKSYGGPNAVAHVFVNRLGATFKGHDFAVPWRATKLESGVIGTQAKGLFIHIELLQPRRRDPAGGPKNDAVAPQPGFTPAQYDKLALLYAAASTRGGKWLIPAFHAAIDDGLDDAHDDPQNFELEQFAAALATLLQRLAEPTVKAELMPAAAPARVAGTQAQTCTAIVSALALLKPGEPLLAQGSRGKTWKALFDDCDRSDTFAGQPLPAHNGRALRCSTDRNQVASLNRYADGTVVFNAKASVDADGSPVVGGRAGPTMCRLGSPSTRGRTTTLLMPKLCPLS